MRSFSPFTPFPPSPTALSPFPESGSDCSLDQQLQRNNAAQLKKATLAYLRACTEGELEGCADGSVLWGGECGELEGEEDATAEGQVRSNPLLHHWRKKQFLIRLRSHEELRSWLVESRLQLGKGLAQEVTLVAATLCEGKLD